MTSDSPAVFGQQWNFRALITTQLLAIALLLSFLIPEGHALWRSLDAQVFYALNGTLADGGDWTRFWAWANVRSSDLITGIVLLISLTFPGFGLQRNQLQPAFIGFVFLLLFVMFPIRYSLYKWASAYGYSGPSPSMTLSPSNLFRELTPDIPAKDRSGRSFPGDHATVLWCWVGVMAYHIRQRIMVLIPLTLALLFMSPRLVGGAHWMTDVLVGGGSVALMTVSVALYTPLVNKATMVIWRGLKPVINLIGRIPGLSLLPFFRGHSRM